MQVRQTRCPSRGLSIRTTRPQRGHAGRTIPATPRVESIDQRDDRADRGEMPSAGKQFGLSFQRPSDPALMRGSGRKSADRAGNEVAVHSRIQPGNHVAGDGDRITAFAVGALRAAGPSGAITCRDMPKLAAGRAPDGPICSTCSTLPTATCSICSEGKPCGMLAEIGDDRTRFADRRGLKAFAGSRPDHPAAARKPLCCSGISRTGARPPSARSGLWHRCAPRRARAATTTPAAPPETGTTKPNDTCSTNSSANFTTAYKPASSTTNTGRFHLLSHVRLDF